MAGRIPRQFIDTLIERSDIVEIVGTRVPLKKAGKEYTACCPFHDEKTPSFTVSRAKQFYHCFGCGAHGNAVDFLMEYDRVGFIDAIEILSGLAGLEIPYEQFDHRGPDHRPLYQLLKAIGDWYRARLRQNPAAITYLKQRGLSGEISARFGIGHAPPGWDNLLAHFGGDDQKLQALRDTGMIVEAEGKRYDRFRERIMFPIRDPRGRIIGFGGRLLGDGKPKYLNSPETPLFHKGQALYGLYEAHQALRHLDRLLVVEGYMDVVALAQFGIDYAVATLGTAATPQHIELLFRHAPAICFCFDGDSAGRDAAWKALNNLLPLLKDGKEVRFLFLPDGEDPDTLIRQEGKDAFETRVVSAQPLSDYLFEHCAIGMDLHSADGQVRYAEQLRPLLDKLPAGLLRQLLYKRLDDLLGIQTPHPARPRTQETPRRSGPRQSQRQPQGLNATRFAVALLLQNPRLGADPELTTDWADSDIPGANFLLELLEQTREQPDISVAQLLERYRDTDNEKAVRKLVAIPLGLPENADIAAELRGALQRLSDKARKARLRMRIRGDQPGGRE